MQHRRWWSFPEFVGEGEEESSLTSLGLRRRCDRRFAWRGRICAKKKSRERCSFPTVSAGGRIERRQFSANRRTRARLVKASGFSSRPEHRTRSDRDGGLCRIAARHSNLAGRAGQEKQVRPLAAFQWIHGGDQDGAPAEEGHYRANVDVMMAIDAFEL